MIFLICIFFQNNRLYIIVIYYKMDSNGWKYSGSIFVFWRKEIHQTHGVPASRFLVTSNNPYVVIRLSSWFRGLWNRIFLCARKLEGRQFWIQKVRIRKSARKFIGAKKLLISFVSQGSKRHLGLDRCTPSIMVVKKCC